MYMETRGFVFLWGRWKRFNDFRIANVIFIIAEMQIRQEREKKNRKLWTEINRCPDYFLHWNNNKTNNKYKILHLII
jgi:hypothetical protein